MEKNSSAGKLVVKYQYMNCMKDNTKWYWEQSTQQNNIIIPTRTIVYKCLDIMTVTEAKKSKVYAIETKNARLYKGFIYF